MLTIDAQSVVVDTTNAQALFTIDFSESPDFFTVDSAGRQADSFQFFVDADGGLPVFRGSPYFAEADTIIRGEEIHLTGNIPIRDTFGEGGSNSGGWGPIRGSITYTLDQDVLTFSVPIGLLNDADGLLSYNLETYEFGGLTDSEYDQLSTVTPSLVNFITGTNCKDTLIGTDGQDNISGLNGKDYLVGLQGNDVLDGGNGSDKLIGVDPGSAQPGLGELDTLTGGHCSDTFVLGDANHVYYNDGLSSSPGLNHYALITDFYRQDTIQLKGAASDYLLDPEFTIGHQTGTGIFLKDAINELIGLVAGVSHLSLNSCNFRFV